MFPFNWMLDAGKYADRPLREKLSYLLGCTVSNAAIVFVFAVWPFGEIYSREMVFFGILPVMASIQIMEIVLVAGIIKQSHGRDKE